MTTSLRVLTYNVQMRSWGMEAGAQGTLTPYTSVEERAKIIAQRILKSPQNYDVLCFQEVFDEDGRDILVAELGPTYPHHIAKAEASIGPFGLPLPPEDSGLTLFSKLPIAASTFEPYAQSSGVDSLAAKGVLYARLLRDGGRPLHLLNSHTQADPVNAIEAHKVTRRQQLEHAFDLLERMVSDVGESEVLFCGDLNIDGMKHPGGYRDEWKEVFDTPGSHFTDNLLDAWTREQCPGGPGPGRTPLPPGFDRGMTAQNQRLDYAIRSRGPSKDRLLLQHMCIAYDIANDAAAPTQYTSDHLPVRIDLDQARPHASALTAEPIPMPPGGPDQTVSGLITEGQMHWYRIEERGGYRIELTRGGPRIHLGVYTADNLSVPVVPFGTLDDPAARDRPGGTRFALPTAPFYLRVSLPDRRGEAQYEVRVHRYAGTGPGDAIPLLRGVPEIGTPKTGAPHSLDDPSTPFSEHDAVWYVAPFDTEPDGSLRVTSTVVVTDRATRAFGALILAREPTGPWLRMAELPADGEVTATAEYDRPLTGYVLVRREDPTFNASQFTVLLTSNVSYLYGNPVNPASRARGMARLFCRDESDGTFGNEWGSDDVQVNVLVNGATRLHIPNSDYLEFDDETLRDLPQVDVIRYTSSAVFELVELDDFSPVDRASVEIPQFDALYGGDKVLDGNAAGVQILVTAIFNPADDEDDDDDGIYDLTITVSREPPRQA